MVILLAKSSNETSCEQEELEELEKMERVSATLQEYVK